MEDGVRPETDTSPLSGSLSFGQRMAKHARYKIQLITDVQTLIECILPLQVGALPAQLPSL